MRILFIHQYFRTPEEGGGIRSYYMCKALIKEGHDVEVITAHNEHNYCFKKLEGLQIHYLPVYYENKLGFAGRIYAFGKFLILTVIKALRLPKADIVYVSSSPLTVGIVAILLKKIKRSPFFFEVMDLWPEAPIQMGFIKNRTLKKILYWLEKNIYNQAKIIIAASPGMEAGIKKVCPSTPTITIPNFSDCDYFHPSPKKHELLKKYHIENKLVCCYTGAIGLSNHLETLIEVAEYLKSKKFESVQFLVAGEGGELTKIKKLAVDKGLTTISFVGHLAKKEVAEVYNISDVNLIFFNSQPILETNSPNKFFDGIAAGLPTIINVKGWIKELCEENRCGAYFNREKPEEFYRIVHQLYENNELLQIYGKNARYLAEKRFNKEKILIEFVQLFKV